MGYIIFKARFWKCTQLLLDHLMISKKKYDFYFSIIQSHKAKLILEMKIECEPATLQNRRFLYTSHKNDEDGYHFFFLVELIWLYFDLNALSQNQMLKGIYRGGLVKS